MTLGELQQAFARYLLDGDVRDLAPAIRPDWFEPAERLAIYRNNFLISLSEALAATFPVTTRMLGDEFMHQIARLYVRSSPPTSPRIAEFGAAFPAFLAARAELRDYAYVPEMAAFEWLRASAWNGANERCLAAPDLSALAPADMGKLRVRLASHAGILDHAYPLAELFAAHQMAEPRLDDIDMRPMARHCLVCRTGGTILATPLAPAQAAFLKSFAAPRELGPAIESGFPEDEREAGETLTLALRHGLFVAAELPA